MADDSYNGGKAKKTREYDPTRQLPQSTTYIDLWERPPFCASAPENLSRNMNFEFLKTDMTD